jgi:(p)ppGpp synthase/HD superfamily hydrolase
MDLVMQAHEFARQVYGNEADLAHPLEVSRLVESTGAPDVLVAAALLHDVLEDTDVTRGQLAAAFGSRVAALVCTLTEDETLTNYRVRKADLRARACSGGPDAGLIFLADKLSNVRRMRRGQKDYKERKVVHYRATLALFKAEQPSLPFLDQLGKELAALRASGPRSNRAASANGAGAGALTPPAAVRRT